MHPLAEQASRSKAWPLSGDWSYLTSWPFVLALGLLVLNDRWFKQQWPSTTTGKLSDFAGLFVLAFLLLGRQPSRRRCLAVLGLAPVFVWWKSSASQAAISAWNRTVPFPIDRTVDLSDSIAVLALPIAAWAALHARPLLSHRVFGWATLGCAWVAIVATSGVPVKVSAEPLTLQYPLSITKAELLADLESRGEVAPGTAGRSSSPLPESFQVRAELMESGYGSCGSLEAKLDIGEAAGHAVVSPREIKMDYGCVGTTDRDSVLAKFKEYYLGRYEAQESQ
jgi:hypothetical protein